MKNVVLEKSFSFATRIVKLHQYLHNSKKEFVMSKQLLRSGTSIGANVTEYWLRLLHTTNYLSDTEFQSIISDCTEIKCLLISIVKSLKS